MLFIGFFHTHFENSVRHYYDRPLEDVSEDENMNLLQRLVQGVAIKFILGHGGQPGPTLRTQAHIVVDICPRVCRGQTED